MASTDEFIFRSKTLHGSVYDALKHMRSQKEFCDITFRIGNRCISAHRVIVAAAIPYFRETLSNNGFQNERSEDVLLDIDAEAFKQLIEYVYSGEISIAENNVKNLLCGAQHLKIYEVREACCDFLIDHLSPGNVLDIWDLACELNHQELAENVVCYVEDIFETISKSEEFEKYPLSLVGKLLDSSRLRVSSEEKVFEALMNWIKKCPDERKENLPQLLKKVRMPLLKPRYLKDSVSKESLVRESHCCRDLLDEARDFHLFPEDRPNTCNFSAEPRFFGRISASEFSMTEHRIVVLYANDIFDEHSYTMKCGFSAARDENVSLEWVSDDSFAFNIASSVELKGKMYLFTKWGILEYMLSNRSLKILNAPPLSLFKAPAVALNGKIYFCGGQTGNTMSGLNDVKCYDPETDKWTDLKCMRVHRSSPGISTLGEEIYVLGGGHENVHSSVERFNPSVNKWRTVAPMLVARYGPSSASVNSKIYCCGGFTLHDDDIWNVSSVVEVYDPVSNQWTSVSSMITERGYFKLLSHNGKLLAIGGIGGGGCPQNAVEIYNPKSDEWEWKCATESGKCIAAVAII